MSAGFIKFKNSLKVLIKYLKCLIWIKETTSLFSKTPYALKSNTNDEVVFLYQLLNLFENENYT